MIGATVDGSDETGLGELADEAAVKTYLDSYTSDWTEPNTETNNPSDTEPFNQGVWNLRERQLQLSGLKKQLG